MPQFETIAFPCFTGMGHARALAEALAEGATAQGREARPIDGERMAEADWAALDNAETIVFRAPTYKGSVSI